MRTIRVILLLALVFVLTYTGTVVFKWYTYTPQPIPPAPRTMYVPDPVTYQKAYDEANAHQKAEVAKESGVLIRAAINVGFKEDNDGKEK